MTRVFINETGETVTYEELVKLRKFATNEAIAVNQTKVLKATIKNAKNILEPTQYDGSSLQSLKSDHHLTVPIAEDIIRTYWNDCSNNESKTKASRLERISESIRKTTSAVVAGEQE